MARKRKHSNEEFQDVNEERRRVGESVAAVAEATSVVSPASSTDQRFESLYAHPRDFKELAQLDSDFAAVVKGRELDFNDPAAVTQLTKTLLKLDFGLDIEMPHDRLCPPVANRHNYILWLKKLTDTTSYWPPGRKLVGLDIGTGASCIYPLLGCTQRPSWSFIATDIDAKNVEFARRNVKLNDLAGRVNILGRNKDDDLIPMDEIGSGTIDFCMTNPPFYASEAEMIESAAQKSQPPFTACTGDKVEMVTEGGEVGFVERILTESLVLGERVQWYTSMLGFLSSVTRLLEMLREKGVDNVAVTEFVQGSKTRRWAVAWSFQAMRPAQSVVRGTSAVPTKSLLPPSTEAEVVTLRLDEGVGPFSKALSSAVGSLELVSWEWDGERLEGIGRAVGNVWNRAWRRRRQQEARSGKNAEMEVQQTITYGFKVWVHVGRNEVSVGCRWLEGHDGVMFESFQGYLKKKAQEIAATSTQST